MPNVPQEAVRALTATEVFEALMPGVPVPAALAELSERVDASLPTGPAAQIWEVTARTDTMTSSFM